MINLKYTTIIAGGWGILRVLASNEESRFDAGNFASDDIMTADVAVIGGGATGTYAAVNLQNLGKSVVLIEKEDRLGGHTSTYQDPATGVYVNYGVQAFWNTSVTRDYFSLLNIPSEAFPSDPLTRLHVDFNTGQQVSLNPSSNLTAYAEQLDQYPYLEYTWNLPRPAPQNLLLPFGDYIRKHGLESAAYSVYFAAQGVSTFLNQLTVNVFKFIDGAYLSRNVIVPASGDNSEIYTRALERLGSRALLSSTVDTARRPSNNGKGVSLVVKTPSGQKLIKASKLLMTIPPLLDALSPFDMDTTEEQLFSQWSYSNYFIMLINNTGLPSGYQFANADSSEEKFHIPATPGLYHVTETKIPGLFYSWYAAPEDMSQAEVQADVTRVIQRLRSLVNSTTSTPPDFLHFKSHTPFKLVVPAEAILGGFYDRLGDLQGYRDTWWTGAAFLSHNGPKLWNFTMALLPALSSD